MHIRRFLGHYYRDPNNVGADVGEIGLLDLNKNSEPDLGAIVGLAFGLLTGALLVVAGLAAAFRWAWRTHRRFAAIRADVAEVRRRHPGRHAADQED